MTHKLISVPKAKNELKWLQSYIEMVESYEADSLDKWIIKEYAYTSSMKEVVNRANAKGFTINGGPVDRNFVHAVINSKPKDELHKILRSGYLLKVRSQKAKGKKSFY